MTYSPYNYSLPKERIAQRPICPYDLAKMLVVKPGAPLESATFLELPNFLRADDLLVFNNTKVLPARLLGSVGGTRVELLLVDRVADAEWSCLAKPMRRLAEGVEILFDQGLRAYSLGRTVVKSTASDRNGVANGNDGTRDAGVEDRLLVRFESTTSEPLTMAMSRVGMMPIPPYIRGGVSDESDTIDYQPRFAQVEGSIAAPTASLHFTDRLMEGLALKGITTEQITLHVGVASFLPLFRADLENKEEFVRLREAPAEERMFYSRSLYQKLQQHRKHGGRVIAVGTTVARALESMAVHFAAGAMECFGNGGETDGSDLLGSTDLFIEPGFCFQLIDGLITNFHQPGTTHLLLVEALVGRERLDEAYNYALSSSYRFLSYGDGMLIMLNDSLCPVRNQIKR